MEGWATRPVAVTIAMIVCLVILFLVLIFLLLVAGSPTRWTSWLRIWTGVSWVAIIIIGFLLPFHIRLNLAPGAAFISLLFVTGAAQIYLVVQDRHGRQRCCPSSTTHSLSVP